MDDAILSFDPTPWIVAISIPLGFWILYLAWRTAAELLKIKKCKKRDPARPETPWLLGVAIHLLFFVFWGVGFVAFATVGELTASETLTKGLAAFGLVATYLAGMKLMRNALNWHFGRVWPRAARRFTPIGMIRRRLSEASLTFRKRL